MTLITANSKPINDSSLLSDELASFLTAAVTPHANTLDIHSETLFEAFGQLGHRGWLAPKNPEVLGGFGLNTTAYQQFQSAIARRSGALAFLQTQHQSAASLLLGSENEALKQTYLSKMATGERRLGVGFSQLRRHPAPVTATAVAGGYRINGVVPWVTGAGLFTHFVGAAMLPDGSAVFGVLPLVNQTENEGQLAVTEPMALAGMAATNTVQVRLENWLLADEQVVGKRPAGWIEGRDRSNPLSPLGLIFGCAQAGIDVLHKSLKRRGIKHNIAEQLRLKLSGLQVKLPEVSALPDAAYAQKIAFRGEAIALMNHCAQAAAVAASGAANTISHPAQRIYKESLVFSVSGQTTDGAIATLDQLLPAT